MRNTLKTTHIFALKTNPFSIFSHDLKTPNGMGDPGGTCGTAGVTAGGTGTGGEPGPAAGGGEPARKAGGATKGLAEKKT